MSQNFVLENIQWRVLPKPSSASRGNLLRFLDIFADKNFYRVNQKPPMFMPRVRVYLALRYTYTPHRRREKNFLRDGMGYSVLMEEDGSYLHLVDFSKQFKLKVLDDTKSE